MTKPNYIPSQNQIRKECLKIQSEWSEETRRKRQGFVYGNPIHNVDKYGMDGRPKRIHCEDLEDSCVSM